MARDWRDRVLRTLSLWRAGSLVLLLVCGVAAQGAELAGRVVAVHDGDTVTVLDAARTQYKIRLAGIDAPELHQAFGRVSQRHLSDAVKGRTVVVEWHKHDKYGRVVGTILLDGHDMNLEQVRAGLAWHYKQYQREQPAADRVAYAHAEIEARAAHLGLWRDPDPLPPWAYRKARKAVARHSRP